MNFNNSANPEVSKMAVMSELVPLLIDIIFEILRRKNKKIARTLSDFFRKPIPRKPEVSPWPQKFWPHALEGYMSTQNIKFQIANANDRASARIWKKIYFGLWHGPFKRKFKFFDIFGIYLLCRWFCFFYFFKSDKN